jgi:hypothetical protein
VRQVVDSSEFGEKLSTALDSEDRKTLEKRLQVRRNRTSYEAVISARFTVFRAWDDDVAAAKRKAMVLAQKPLRE